MRALCLGIWLSTFLSLTVHAGEYLNNLRFDQSVPFHCQNTRINHFEKEIEYITVSLEGGESKGFTYEYPLDRRSANELWNEAKNIGKISSSKHPRLFQLIKDNYEHLGFDFHNEGEILEILVVLEFQEALGDEFFVTGSVAYHHRNDTRLIGELDLVVGRVDNCQVVTVGEVKMSTSRLRKAQSQLQRFQSFLYNVNPNAR